MTKYFTKDGDDYKEVAEPLHTQSEMDDVITSRLDRQKKQFADYDDLKTKAASVDTIKTEYEGKLKTKDTEKSDLEKQLTGAKLETSKVKIVSEFKLTDELAEFVTGETENDMRAKAEKLAKNVTGGSVKIDKKDKPADGKNADSAELAKKLFGNKSDD